MFSKENSNYLVVAENDKEKIGFIIGLYENDPDEFPYPEIIDEDVSELYFKSTYSCGFNLINNQLFSCKSNK